MYYTTPIFSFRMKCHLCSNWIEIHTDPKNTEYVIVSGARRKIEDWDAKENGSIELTDEKEKEKLESNAFYKLENDITNKKKTDESIPILTQLQNLNNRQWKDPYTASYNIRKKFRERKKLEKQKEEEDKKFKDKHLLAIELLPESLEDEEEAKLVFKEDKNDSINKVNQRKLEIQNTSIFENSRKKNNNKRKYKDMIMNSGHNDDGNKNNYSSTNIYKNSKKSKHEAKMKSLTNLKLNIIQQQKNKINDNDHSSTSFLISDIQKPHILPLYNEISSKNLGIQKKSNKNKMTPDFDHEKKIDENNNNIIKKENDNNKNVNVSDDDYDKSNALSLICQDYGDDEDSN